MKLKQNKKSGLENPEIIFPEKFRTKSISLIDCFTVSRFCLDKSEEYEECESIAMAHLYEISIKMFALFFLI
jgi:hypothetical protein